VPIEQAFALVDNGEVDNAATIICLQWLKLNQDKLKE
jgi:ADP-ribose pyrophosphatase